LLPQILSKHGALPAEHSRDDPSIELGRIFETPPDQHLWLDEGFIGLSKRSREKRARPSSDLDADSGRGPEEVEVSG